MINNAFILNYYWGSSDDDDEDNDAKEFIERDDNARDFQGTHAPQGRKWFFIMTNITFIINILIARQRHNNNNNNNNNHHHIIILTKRAITLLICDEYFRNQRDCNEISR